MPTVNPQVERIIKQHCENDLTYLILHIPPHIQKND